MPRRRAGGGDEQQCDPPERLGAVDEGDGVEGDDAEDRAALVGDDRRCAGLAPGGDARGERRRGAALAAEQGGDGVRVGRPCLADLEDRARRRGGGAGGAAAGAAREAGVVCLRRLSWVPAFAGMTAAGEGGFRFSCRGAHGSRPSPG
jgi:hypothetical protein